MIEVRRYNETYKDSWNEFVSLSSNSSFMFERDYMEYHSDRFCDYSLMLFENEKLKALLPGNVKDGCFMSHQGLTFGGIINMPDCSYEKAVSLINEFNLFLHKACVKTVVVKTPPFFYSPQLQQVYDFIFQYNQAVSKSIGLGACIYLPTHEFPKKCVKRGKLDSYDCVFSDDLSLFWGMLEENLQVRHAAKPVHDLSEISALRNMFSDKIKLLCIVHSETKELHAAALLYENVSVVKVQYFATSAAGRANRASDVLYYNLISHYKNEASFIDFGSNMSSDGMVNASLVATKEKFGAVIFPINKYEFDTSVVF